MRNWKGKLKQTLSVLLAAAMLVTSVPQGSMTVYAAEQQADAVTADAGAEDGQAAGKDGTSEDGQNTGEEGTSEDGQNTGEEGTSEDGQNTGEEGTSEDGQNTGEDDTSEDDQTEEEKSAADVTEEEEKEAQEETEETYAVRFLTANATVTDVKVAGNAVTLSENSITVAAGSELSFKVSADENNVVTEVKAGETPLTADDAEVYTVESVTGELLVTVDTASIYEVTFSASRATVTDVKVDGSAVTPAENKLTVMEHSTLSFKVSADNGYEVTAVKLGETPLTAGVAEVYTVEDITSSLSITVTTAQVHTIAFYGEHFTVTELKVNDQAASLSNNSITVSNLSSMDFKIVPETGYKVTDVTYQGGTGSLTPDSDGVYHMDRIAGARTVIVTTKSETDHTVSFTGNDYSVSDVYINEEPVSETNGEIEVPDKAELVFGLKASSGYRIKSVSIVGKSETLSPDCESGYYKIENIEEDLTVAVETEQIPEYTITIAGENANWYAMYEDASGEGGGFEDDQSSYRVLEGATFYLCPEAKSGYRLGQVKVKDTVYTMKAGSYYYQFDNVTADMTINVETIKVWQIGFTYEKSEAKVSIIGADGKEEAYDGTSTLEVDDKKSLKFKVSPDTYCLVESVVFVPETAEGSNEEENNEEEPSETAGIPITQKDGCYELTNVQTAGTIRINTKVEADANSIIINDFAYANQDDNFDLSAVEIPITVDGKAVKPGDTIRTKNAKVKLKIDTETCAYDATAVLKQGVTNSCYIDKSYEREISFSAENRVAELTLQVAPKKQFRLDHAAKQLGCIISGENVAKKAGSEDVYVVGGLWEKFTVDVTVAKNSTYEPKVVLGDKVLEAKGTPQEVKSGKSVFLSYRYEIDPEKLKKTTESDIVFLHILQEEKASYLILEGEDLQKMAELKVNADGQYLSALESNNQKAAELLGEKSGLVYAVSPKAKLSITAEPYCGWKLTSAQAQSMKGDQWSEPNRIKLKNAGFTYNLTASGMDKLTITGKAEPELLGLERVNGEGLDAVDPVKGVYYVEIGKTYMTNVHVVNVGMASDISGEIKNGNQLAATTFNNANREFTAAAADAGKTLTGSLKYQGEVFASFKLYVRPYVTDVKVKGVSSKGELTQQIGSEKEYEITAKTPKNAAADYTVALEGDLGISAETTEDGKLRINTENAKVGAEAQIVLKAYNGTEHQPVKGGAIKVKVTEPKLPKPTVKSISANDVSMTLLLDSKTPEQTGENVKYRVTVTPTEQSGKTRPAEISAEPIVKEYVWEAKKTQTIVVSTAEEGRGKGWKFNVQAEVIYLPGEESEEKTECFQSAASKKIVVFTKDACYETNLKFKQNAKSKKLYTGQTAELGTVQFGKNTTFKGNLSAEDVTLGLYNAEKLELWFEGDKLYARAANGNSDLHNLLGTHVIRIDAEAPEAAISSFAEVKVNVIPAICKMTISGVTETLYKQNKKAAALKLDLTYRYADSSIAPATKKAVWSVKDADGEEFEPGDPLYGMITVKNGKVTVNKNYVASSNPEENGFRVYAQAADYEGNAVYVRSACITIKAQKDVMGEVLLFGSYDDWNFVPIAKNGDTITAETLKGYSYFYAAVKKAGAKSQASYTRDEIETGTNGLFIPRGNLKFTASGKGITLNEDGRVVSMQAGKSVTIKVQTLDGSKQTAKLKLKVDYEKEQKLGLIVALNSVQNVKVDGTPLQYPFYWEMLADAPEQRTISYQGLPGYSMGMVCVRDAVRDDYATNGLNRFDLKAEGAKLFPVVEYGIEGYYLLLEDKDVKITLTDSVSGEKVSYILHNELLSTTKAPEIEAESVGLKDGFAAYEKADRPKLTLTLPPKTGGYKDTYLQLTPKMENAMKNMGGYSNLYYEVYGNENCFDHTGGRFKVGEDGTVTLPFGDKNSVTGLYETELTEGTYEFGAYLLTVAKGSEEPTILTEMMTIPITVNKEKVKASFRFPTSVQLKKTPGASANLTIKYAPTELQYEVTEVLDTVAGGEKNDFTKYFEIVENEQKAGYVLKLKDTVTEAELERIDKKDLTGYVQYKAYTKDHTFWKQERVKITVKFK